MNKEIIPVFYACDDRFLPYTIVSMKSLIENASKDREHIVYILNSGLTEEHRREARSLETNSFHIEFADVREYLDSLSSSLPIRDYYSMTTYYRLFIGEMFPQYRKAIYLDSDTIIKGNIDELFDTDIKDCLLGACHERVMIQEPVYGKYAETVVGISRNSFFNAGILLLNLDQMREGHILSQFSKLLKEYTFVVTQDEDYLNVLAKDRVYWLGQEWNAELFRDPGVLEKDRKIIHYVFAGKPWKYKDCPMREEFLSYARKTPYLSLIEREAETYSEESKKKDEEAAQKLLETAKKETARKDSFFRLQSKGQSLDRLAILLKIQEYEYQGKFDKDVEADPPTKPLLPGDVDYLRKGLFSKVKKDIAFSAGYIFMKTQLFKKNMIIKDIVGIENFSALSSGAIITCNHFNAFDSFAIQAAYMASHQHHRKFYRVIREGNYTSFPGFYGFIMRNCNTLPLSSNIETLKKFIKSTDTLLKKGDFVLFYPEQSMWWNYRKPKPLKPGAYKFAARNKVPVLPCFITMEDSNVIGEDGFPVQAYTIHIGKAIYPKPELDVYENENYMMEENSRVWKEIYEANYSKPLVYLSPVNLSLQN